MVQARSAIVKGAVDIASTALESLKVRLNSFDLLTLINLQERGIEFQPAEATYLVSNLLTVICSETEVQPTLPISAR